MRSAGGLLFDMTVKLYVLDDSNKGPSNGAICTPDTDCKEEK